MATEIALPIRDGEMTYYQSLFDAPTSRRLFDSLYKNTPWTQRSINLYGRTIPMPRLTAWFADRGIHYAYSGGQEPRHDWTPILLEIKHRVEQTIAAEFNGALLNLYRDGNDCVGWHSDNESVLGDNPVIASVSLGATRRFRLRHKENEARPISIELESGSLLVMSGQTQCCWRHQLPKTRRPSGPRVNVTFRRVLTD